MMPDTVYLIWSIEHGAWWRPDRRGYTRHLDEAGRYPHVDALEILDDANGQGRLCHECLIPVFCVEP